MVQRRQASLPSTYESDEVATIELGENTEAGEAEAIPATAIIENEDWVYSAAETPGGENVGLDLDDEPGFTAQWSAGQIKNVRVTLSEFDVIEHAITNVPDAGDTVKCIVTVNDVEVVEADEGLVTQNEIAIQFNIDRVIPVAGGQVARLALHNGGLFELADWDATVAELNLHPG